MVSKRKFKKVLRPTLKAIDAIEDTEELLAILASLHDSLEKYLMAGGYGAALSARTLDDLEFILANHAVQLKQYGQEKQMAAWLAGIYSMEEILGGVEIKFIKGLTGIENDLVKKFLTIDRIKNVTAEMQDSIRGLVTQGAMLEMTPFQVMQGITDVVGIRDMAGFRELGTTGISAKAERIMRTEMGTILSAGNHHAMMQVATRFPDLKRIWIATGDERTRDSHLAAHEQVVGIDEPFTVGGYKAMFPRDPNLPPQERINCRCAEIPYRDDWGEPDDLMADLNDEIDAEISRREKAE